MNLQCVPDPYAGLIPPNQPGGPVVSGGPFSDGANHGPGVYTKTLTFSSPGTYTLASGIYVLEQGISVTGQANLLSAVLAHLHHFD